MVVATWLADVAENALYVYCPHCTFVALADNCPTDVQLQEQIKYITTQLQIQIVATSKHQVVQLSINPRVHVEFESRSNDRAN